MSRDDDDGVASRVKNAVLGGGALVFVLDAFAGGFDIFLTASTTLFPMLAVMSGTLADHIAVFDHPWVHQALIVVALAYLLNLSLRLVSNIRAETD